MWPLFGDVVLSVISDLTIILRLKRTMVALLCVLLSRGRLCFFLTVPLIGLWYVIVTFLGHIYLFFMGEKFQGLS